MRDRRKLMLLLLAAVFSLTGAFRATCEPRSEMEDANGAGVNEVATGRKVANGLWGGEHISLEVTNDGARIEYDCAHGAIERALVLDRRGRFAVTGTHVEERGGPVREGLTQSAYAVRLTGQVSGTRMRLTVRRSDDKSLVGTFTLVRGQEPSLVKCR